MSKTTGSKKRKAAVAASDAPAPEMSMDLTELVKACAEAKEAGKAGYAESDRLLQFIKKRVKSGKVIEYSVEVDGESRIKRAKIVNNHANGKTHYCVSGCRPYELVEA